jgi:DNA mismatch repair ATPase MutL
MKIQSRNSNEFLGQLKIFKTDGKLISTEFMAFNVGTLIEIESLFETFPVRKQCETKSNRSAQLKGLIKMFYLIHFDKRFELDFDENITIYTPSKDAKDAIQQVYGMIISDDLREIIINHTIADIQMFVPKDFSRIYLIRYILVQKLNEFIHLHKQTSYT